MTLLRTFNSVKSKNGFHFFPVIAFSLSVFNISFPLLGVVTHTCNPSTREAEVGGSFIPDQPVLHRENLSQKEKKRKPLLSIHLVQCTALYSQIC
jgi:hypothetical protein